MPRLVEIWLKLIKWFWRNILKCEKFTDGRTDKKQTTDDHNLSSLELSAQVVARNGFSSKDS